MKKFTCSRIKTLSEAEIEQVTGGVNWGGVATAICSALGGGDSCLGCSAGASSAANSGSGSNYSGGCGAGAWAASGK